MREVKEALELLEKIEKKTNRIKELLKRKGKSESLILVLRSLNDHLGEILFELEDLESYLESLKW